MGELLTSIPGDIPGLLRRGSPVLVLVDSDGLAVVRGVVLDPSIEPNEDDPRCLVWNERNGRDNKAQMFVRLDLSGEDGKTGRAHAAWWVERCDAGVIHGHAAALGLGYGTLPAIIGLLGWAKGARKDDDERRMDALARLVLRLAGRA